MPSNRTHRPWWQRLFAGTVLASGLIQVSSVAAQAVRVGAPTHETPNEELNWNNFAAKPKLVRARQFLLKLAKAHYNAGRADSANDQEQYALSLAALHLAHALAPKQWLLFNMAQVERKLGHCRQAHQHYTRALEGTPGKQARADAEHGLSTMAECHTSDEASLFPLGIEVSHSQQFASLPVELPAALILADSSQKSADSVLPPIWVSGGLAALAVVSSSASFHFWEQAKARERDYNRRLVAGPEVQKLAKNGYAAQAKSLFFASLALSLSVGATVNWLTPHPRVERKPTEPSLGSFGWHPVEGGGVVRYIAQF